MQTKDIGQYVHIVSNTMMSVILPFVVVYMVLMIPHLAALLIMVS